MWGMENYEVAGALSKQLFENTRARCGRVSLEPDREAGMYKRLGIALLLLLVVFVGYRFAVREDTNARVAEEIRTNPQGERAQRSMLVTLADGRMYPVNFLREGDRVFMGIDGRWWREFVGDGQPVEMLIQGEVLHGHAITVLDDPAYTADVFTRLRPTVPNWLPDWLNAKLVVITLRDTGTVDEDGASAADG